MSTSPRKEEVQKQAGPSTSSHPESSISEQVQHSVSQDKLDVIAVKIDEAKETIIGRIRRLMTMEISDFPITTDASLNAEIGEAKEFLNKKVNDLEESAEKVTEDVRSIVNVLDKMQGLHTECVNLEKYMAIPQIGTSDTGIENVRPLVEKLVSQHPSTFGLPSSLFRLDAFEFFVEDFLKNFDSLPQTEERLLLKQDIEVAKELMERHTESMTDEQFGQTRKFDLLVAKEKLRLFCKRVELFKNDPTGAFIRFHMLQDVLDNYRAVDRDQRAVNMFIIARKRFHEQANNPIQLNLYIALEELGASDEVAAETARYFLAHDKSVIGETERAFYLQVQEWTAASMFHNFYSYLVCAKHTTCRVAGLTEGDVMRMSWKKMIPSTIELKWQWKLHFDNDLLKARANLHFEHALDSGLANKMLIFYEFLLKVDLHSPLFDQDFTYLEDYSKVCDEEEFSVVEKKFFQCLFPALDFP